MAVGLTAPDNIQPIAGIELATTRAGIYKNKQREDMVLLRAVEGASTAAVFTRNQFCAAPVIVARQHLQQNTPRYLLINAGNANAGTGDRGITDAEELCQCLADHVDCDANQVLPFSTGVIGEYLPVEKMSAAFASLVSGLSAENWLPAASAIMTTDTLPKAVTVCCQVGNESITFTGMAKGAGMIRPDMATMLAFIATDASIDKSLLHEALATAVNKSFNRITVDGDTSTNDACVIMASGLAGNTPITSTNEASYSEFVGGLEQVCQYLAQAIVRDGEGASKFVTIHVKQASTQKDCLAVAYRVAHSPLVKTALTASDANWGRILAAVGSAGADRINIDRVKIYLDDVCIVHAGQRAADYTEEQGQQVMSREEITITIDMQDGDEETTVWTTDLSYDYIKINAEYRT